MLFLESAALNFVHTPPIPEFGQSITKERHQDSSRKVQLRGPRVRDQGNPWLVEQPDVTAPPRGTAVWFVSRTEVPLLQLRI